MAEASASVTISAPRDRVWSVVSDHERMVSWGMLRAARLTRPGASERNGVGAVRVLEAPGQKIEEEIVAWDPPRGYEYRLLAGAPVKNHRGRIDLTELSPGQTKVTWRVEFDPSIPFTGRAMALGLQLGFSRMLDGLKKVVERGG